MKFDPALNRNLRQTASIGNDIWPTDPPMTDSDSYDEAEKEPEPHYFDTMQDNSFKDAGKMPYVTAEGNTYSGKSSLKYSNESVTPTLEAQFPCTKKVPYNQAKNMCLVPEAFDEFPTAEIEPRKSTRTKNKPTRLTYNVSKWGCGLPMIMGLIGFAVFNTHVEAQMNMISDKGKNQKVVRFMIPKSESNQMFCAYHTKLNAFNHHYGVSDSESHLWDVQDILEYKLRKKGETINVRLKVQWKDGEKSWENLEILKHHAPKEILEYILKNGLINKPGWEWIHQFLEANDQLSTMRKIYLASKDVAKYKFGVEVAKSPKHAL